MSHDAQACINPNKQWSPHVSLGQCSFGQSQPGCCALHNSCSVSHSQSCSARMLQCRQSLSCRFRRAALPLGYDAEMTCCVLCDRRFEDLCRSYGTARPPGHAQAQGRGGRGAGTKGFLLVTKHGLVKVMRSGLMIGKSRFQWTQQMSAATAGSAVLVLKGIFSTGGQRAGRAAGGAGGRHPTAGRAAARRGAGRGRQGNGAADIGRGAPRSRRRDRDSSDDDIDNLNRGSRARTGPRWAACCSAAAVGTLREHLRCNAYW